MVEKKTNYFLVGIMVIAVVGIAFFIFSSGRENITGNVIDTNKVSSQQQDTVTCNSPYIKVGTSCCLDQNSNNICDSDEVDMLSVGDSIKTEEPLTCIKGYTEDYTCSSVYSLRKYQKEDCSYEWIKWEHCGAFPCKMENGNAICDYENKYDYAKDYDFCAYSEIESLEESGLWTSRSGSYEYSDTISDRAKIGIPLLIQGGLDASYGKTKDNLTEGVCGVGNAQINIKIYKEDLELFFDTVKTNRYGRWESEKFIPREEGYYKAVVEWTGGNSDLEGWQSIEFTFYVSE